VSITRPCRPAVQSHSSGNTPWPDPAHPTARSVQLPRRPGASAVPEYVEPVLDLLEKAHEQLPSVPDYTQGRRRGRPRKHGN